jgi:hypothetical protein
MSMLFGVSNLGKSIDEMNKDSINKSWLQVGSNLREAYNNTKQKYNYNET